MNTQADQFGMKEALAQLGVKDINEGTSTGQHNFSNGTLLESYSPVDGQLIGKVKQSAQRSLGQIGFLRNGEIFARRLWRSARND